MRTLFFVFLVSVLHQIGFSEARNEIMEQMSEVHQDGEESCNGPGSDPYRNFAFNGRCICKRNVRGMYCSDCKKNAFDLRPQYQHGCLRCFCSGATNVCSPSDWKRDRLFLSFKNNTQGIELVRKDRTVVAQPLQLDAQRELVFVDNLPSDSYETYFWKLPESFLGDRLTSYGGYMNFSINYELHPSLEKKRKKKSKWLKDPLVIMKGNDVTLYYRFRKRNRNLATHFLPLMEQSWYRFLPKKKKKTRSPEGNSTLKAKKTKGKSWKRKRARRRDLMRVLSNLQYILVKANYKPDANRVSLLLMSMSHAVPESTALSETATAVESCECPKGYGGLSCQYCSSGFTLDEADSGGRSRRTGPKKCRPCDCNGHSNTCHHRTGKCVDCKHHTAGDHCQHSLLRCDERGTYKHDTSPGIISRCACKVRSQGELCDSCKMGHFNLDAGNEKGCSKCWCSGVTFKCSSSKLRRFQIRIQPPAFINMGLYDYRGQQRLWANKFNNGMAKFMFKKYEDFFDFHWSLPKTFTGNLLKSYGGKLYFSLYNDGVCEEKTKMNPFVELESFEGESIRWKFSPTAITNAPLSFSVLLVEKDFVYYDYDLVVERSMFLRILSSVKSIKIYVPNCEGLKSTEISNVILDTSVSWATELPLASEVEECQCPPEYSGLSCELCAPGYVKDSGKRCVSKSIYS